MDAVLKMRSVLAEFLELGSWDTSMWGKQCLQGESSTNSRKNVMGISIREAEGIGGCGSRIRLCTKEKFERKGRRGNLGNRKKSLHFEQSPKKQGQKSLVPSKWRGDSVCPSKWGRDIVRERRIKLSW